MFRNHSIMYGTVVSTDEGGTAILTSGIFHNSQGGVLVVRNHRTSLPILYPCLCACALSSCVACSASAYIIPYVVGYKRAHGRVLPHSAGACYEFFQKSK